MFKIHVVDSRCHHQHQRLASSCWKDLFAIELMLHGTRGRMSDLSDNGKRGDRFV